MRSSSTRATSTRSSPGVRASSTAAGCATPSRRSTRPTQARLRCHPPASRHLAFAAAPRRSSSTRATPTPSATARPPSTASSLAARTLWATAAPPSRPLLPLLSPTTAPLPPRRRRAWQLRRPRQPRRPRRPLRQRGQCFSSKWSRSCRRSGARARRPRKSVSARASRNTRRSARRSAGDALRSRGGAGGMREKLRRAPVRLAKTLAPTRRRLRERLLSLREATVLRVSSTERDSRRQGA
mmetsp:Transcript_33841/g.112909  ORF Transcript_33841/g.112909 Transcript_33841/m.112909 type:complete len:240 (+) Transcript_33841:1086-1805(+)